MKVSRHSVCEKCCVSPKVWIWQATNAAGRLYWSRRLPFVSGAESDCTSPPLALRLVTTRRKYILPALAFVMPRSYTK